MNKTMKLAVAAALAMGASAAQAGITIPAGDWTIDIGGNVNAYYSNTKFDGDIEKVIPDGDPMSENANMISTGLLPSALGIGGKTRQNDLDVAFQFTFFTGVNSEDAGSGGFSGNGAQGNSLNIRQAFLTFGDKSWGTIKMGRDLGVFGSDAILSDMTLLGVGVGAGGGGNSTLGRIGSGYLYADWVGQIQYASPNWNGFSFAVAAREPWGNTDNSDLGFDGKVSYEWAGDVAGKVWAGYIHQKIDNGNVGATHKEETADAWEIGAKASFGGFSLVGYYYDGQNFGTPAAVDLTGAGTSGAGPTLLSGLGIGYDNITDQDHDVDGGYIQGTYTLPGAGTKIGASWGISRYEETKALGALSDDFEAESWMLGVYHPLTKSLNLVAEYVDAEYDNYLTVKNAELEARTISLGAILFF